MFISTHRAQPLLSVVGNTFECISHQQDHFIPQPSLNAVRNTKEGISTQTCSFQPSYEKIDNTVSELLRSSSKVTQTTLLRGRTHILARLPELHDVSWVMIHAAAGSQSAIKSF